MMTSLIRTPSVLAAALLLVACAAQKEQPSTQDLNQAIRDFIEVRQLEQLDALRSGNRDTWQMLNEHFILYEGRRDTYLVEFGRRCIELRDNTRITADTRWDPSVVRARFDTIRGCRISHIYALSGAELAELENIGDAPGENK